MTDVKDDGGNPAGSLDSSTGSTKPSKELAKESGKKIPSAKLPNEIQKKPGTGVPGGPIDGCYPVKVPEVETENVITYQIKLGKWTIFADDDGIYARGPGGGLQFLLWDPGGITEEVKPNKLSDNADKSSGNSKGNTKVSGRTVDAQSGTSGSSAPAFQPQPSTNTGGGAGSGASNVETTFSASSQDGRAAAEKYLGRKMSDSEWNNLVSATYAESGRDQKEQAWVMGTILNRSRTSGLDVNAVLNQPSQFTSVTGTSVNPHPSANFTSGPPTGVESSINGSAVNYLDTVPTNNYYFNAASPGAVQAGESYVTQRNGVQGMVVGKSFVYPGAKWP